MDLYSKTGYKNEKQTDIQYHVLFCWSAAMDPTCGVTVLSLLMQLAMPPSARTNHKRATVSYKYYKGS